MANLNEKIELEIGAPVTVAFAYDQGRLCSKRWPGAEDCYSRATSDGRVLFVDSAEEMRLRKTVRAGQPVILCREKTAAGSKYLTIKSAPPELKGPLGVVNGRTIPEAKYAGTPAIEPPALAFPETDSKAEQPQADTPTLIMRCMVAAVDAAAKATAHGQQIGFPVTFGPGEIERIAVTLYINSAQSGPPRYSKPNGQARSHYNGNAAARA
jgi:hypothetical protein